MMGGVTRAFINVYVRKKNNKAEALLDCVLLRALTLKGELLCIN